MIRSVTTLALGATLFLAACTGGSETSSSQAGQFETYREAIRDIRAPKPELPALTPALVASLPTAALELVIEDRGATAYLVPYSDRTDRRPGALRIWRSADAAQIVLRDGVLVTTRGLGNDLGSSRVSSVLSSIESLSPVSGPHNLFVKGYDNRSTRIDLECEMQSLGSETIDIVQTRHPVIHLRENCTGPDGAVTNDYWVSPSDRTVWQSRQWGGPNLGYLRMRLLKK